MAGVGNEGAAQGHASGYIKNVGDRKTIDIRIPREIKFFSSKYGYRSQIELL